MEQTLSKQNVYDKLCLMIETMDAWEAIDCLIEWRDDLYEELQGDF